ncbi:MAG: hypothetical protein GF364_18075 [Candidatus Lokiarchaeota archaeon]|nr:hypothetical protein [Candidatus Lokiarchaeota archaeon]
MNKQHTLKVELAPAVLNFPFVGLFLYFLLYNQEHWTLFNATLIMAIGIEINWVFLLLAIIGIIGVINLAIILIGLIKLKILYRGKRIPYIFLFPAVSITLMFACLIAIVQVEERVDLAYLFTQIGGAAFLVFLLLTIGVYVIFAWLLYLIIKLSRTQTSERHHGRINLKFVAIITLYSCILVVILLLWLASFYSQVDSFWNTYSDLLSYFVNWNGLGIILWGSALLTTGLFQILNYKMNHSLDNYSKKTQMRFFLLVLVIFHVISIVFIILSTNQIVAVNNGIASVIWPYLAIIFISGSLLSFIPQLIYIYKRSVRKRISKLKNPLIGKIAFVFAIHSKEEATRMSEDKSLELETKMEKSPSTFAKNADKFAKIAKIIGLILIILSVLSFMLPDILAIFGSDKYWAIPTGVNLMAIGILIGRSESKSLILIEGQLLLFYGA